MTMLHYVGLDVHKNRTSMEVLDAHGKQPHMKAFGQVVPTIGVRGMKIQKYEVSSVGPLR